MKQQQFEQLHQKKWRYFEQLLNGDKSEGDITAEPTANLTQQNTQADNPFATPEQTAISNQTDIANQLSNQTGKLVEPSHSKNSYDFIRLYRLICQHYSLAKQRHYSPQLVSQLHELVTLGHRELYQRQGNIWSRMFQFYAYTFPVRFREHIKLFWLSLAFFAIPFVLMGVLCFQHSDLLYTIMDGGQVHNMQDMYNPDNDMIGRDSSRKSDSDVMMFGFYVYNNVGIDFRIYAMGLFAGIGTLLSVLYNGLVIGGVAGHLTGMGYGETFWSFVAGHSSFELTAAVISGAAGLRLAQALFMPGNFSRGDAFKIAGKQSIEILIGAATMTFIAAFIEAFWSSSSIIPNMVKYGMATFLWVLVISYLMFAGRSRQ